MLIIMPSALAALFLLSIVAAFTSASTAPSPHHDPTSIMKASSINNPPEHQELKASRSATIHYSCFVSGPRSRDFAWSATWDSDSSDIEIFAEKHIDSFEHLEIKTNDFRTWFHHGFILDFGGYCCLHTFKVGITGVLYDQAIEMDIDTSHRLARRMQVKEFCAARCGSGQGRVHYRDCTVTSTVS